MEQKSDTPERTEISQLGEFRLIDRLAAMFPLPGPDVIKGIGDDAAVLDYADDPTVVVSTDMLVEGIHFDLMYTPLKHLGYKAVVVNLSDIYAMNARPRHILVSVAVSNRFSVEALEELYMGIRAACNAYGVELVGGDTTASLKGLTISVTAMGHGDSGTMCYRSGAQVGDLVCISGDLGAAYLGLQLLEREKKMFIENPDIKPDLGPHAQYLVGRLLKPEARHDIIKQMADFNIVPTAMIDISDGLASELFHICKQSGVGVLLDESGVPMHQTTQLQAIEFKLDPITCALSGGEDYEILFTVRPEDVDRVRYMTDVYIAGEIVPAAQGLKLRTVKGHVHDLKAQGWAHF